MAQENTQTILDRLRQQGLDNQTPTAQDLLLVLELEPVHFPALLGAASAVRQHHHGLDVKVHVLSNAKSGACPEDCGFCSQSAHHNSDIPLYRLKTVDQLVAEAKEAHRAGAFKFCMVTATRQPHEKDLETFTEAARRIKAEVPITLCASLGFLTAEKARVLKEAGIDRYNHNLETSRENFPTVVRTHGFDDRVNTVKTARDAGMEACCGLIVGLGEDRTGRVELALTLRELGVESVPVNFLNSRPGTPLAHLPSPTPWESFKTLAMCRFALPERDLRAAGGREVCLKHLQAPAMFVANSLFAGGYLTTGGLAPDDTVVMLQELGMNIIQMEPAPVSVGEALASHL